MANPWMSNPYAKAVKKYIVELMGDKYNSSHEEIISRIIPTIANENDIQKFVNLITIAHNVGFNKAVNQYRSILEENGFKVNVVPAKTDV